MICSEMVAHIDRVCERKRERRYKGLEHVEKGITGNSSTVSKPCGVIKIRHQIDRLCNVNFQNP